MNLLPSRSTICTVPSEVSVRNRLPCTMVVESCGAVTCRAFLLKTPSVLVTPTSAPPVTLLCCVYLKSARLVPAAPAIMAIVTRNVLVCMTPSPFPNVQFSMWVPKETPAIIPLLLCQQRCLVTARVDLLCRAHRCAIFHVLVADSRQHVLERAQDADRVEIVVVPDVSDPEQLALHLSLAVRHHGVERLAEFLHDLAGVEPIRSSNRRKSSGRRGSVKTQSQSLRSCPGHFRA